MSAETKNMLDLIKTANQTAAAIVRQAVQGLADTPDAVEARRAELKDMKKDDLIARILELEAPKNEGGIKIESVARKILEDPACAVLNYEQIAGLITTVIPAAKTSSKSIASYVSKHKDTWSVVARIKPRFNQSELLGMIEKATNGSTEPAEEEKTAVNQ